MILGHGFLGTFRAFLGALGFGGRAPQQAAWCEDTFLVPAEEEFVVPADDSEFVVSQG